MESLSLPEDVKSQLERFEAAVSSVETGLAPILALDRRELEAALTPLERAKVHVSMANAVSTLFSMYLKAVGLDPADHAVKRELERVALYRTKLDKAAERRAAGKAARSAVDAAAAGRMVERALGTGRDEPNGTSEGEEGPKRTERKRKSGAGGKGSGKKKKR